MQYASIRSLDISNGESVGVALFVQGCDAHCKNCFNPETWDFSGGKPWTQETFDNFMKLIDRPYIKRVSFLGGEPLHPDNFSMITWILLNIKKKFPEKKVWLYTGYTWDKICEKYFLAKYDENNEGANYEALCFLMIKYSVDVLVEGPFVDELKDISLKWRGSSNQRVIDVKKTMKNIDETNYKTPILYCD